MSRRRYRNWWGAVVGWTHYAFHLATLPFAFAVGMLGDAWWNLRMSLERSGVRRWWQVLLFYLLLPFLYLGQFLAWTGMELLQWPRFLNLRYLLEGLPALVVGVGIILTLAVSGASGDLDTRYKDAARRAFFDGDERKLKAQEARAAGQVEVADSYEEQARTAFEAALVYFKALLRNAEKSGAQTDEFRYNVALATYGLGEFARAEAIMNDLAPRHEQGYGPAHYWKAQQIIATAQDSSWLTDAQVHLERAVEWNAAAYDAQITLGRIHLMRVPPAPQSSDRSEIEQWDAVRRQRLEAAERCFQAAVNGNRPEALLLLARVHVIQGRRELARAEAERALAHYSAKEQADLDDIESRLRCAEAHMFLEQMPQAADVLSRGMVIRPDPRYNAALSKVYLVWADMFRRDARSSLVDQHRLLQQAYLADPYSRLLLRRLVVGLRSGPAEAEATRNTLNFLVTQRPDQGLLHFLLAFDALERRQATVAEQHLADAVGKGATVPYQVAELARSLLEGQPIPDLAEAMVSLGLRAWPGDPDLRHCRGFLLAQRRKWSEAMVELEAARKVRPTDNRLLGTLFVVYQNLGLRDEAEAVRRLLMGAEGVAVR